jgi:hypothetical protein
MSATKHLADRSCQAFSSGETTSRTMETQLKRTAVAQPMSPAKNMNSTMWMAKTANL